MTGKTKKPQVAAIGEIVSDILPDSRKLGGAPADFLHYFTEILIMKKRILSDTLFTAVTLTSATVISFLFFHFGNNNPSNITIIYTLALIIAALKTSGYVYGAVSAVFGVVAVNYFFSYPYFKFNFTLAGYPL